MLGALHIAFNEITLVIFTTCAPSGALASILLSAVWLKSNEDSRSAIGRILMLPFMLVLIGLVVSATHLGTPDNALYVFTRIGLSPLSTEVCAAVAFLVCTGFFWFYQFTEHAKQGVLKFAIILSICSAFVFIWSMANAYSGRTIITWDTPYVPVALCVNACIGGPFITILGLVLAKSSLVHGRLTDGLLGFSFVSFLANVAVYVAQIISLNSQRNWVSEALDLVPYPWSFLLMFSVLVLLGFVFCIHAKHEHFLDMRWLIVSVIAVLSGIFFMRFMFYMLHMTVGISI